MKFLSILAGVAIAAAMGMAAQAATLYTQTTPAGAAALFPGQSVATFDAAASGTYTSYTEAGITFTADQPMFIDNGYIGAYNTFGVNSLHNCYCGTSFSTVTMTFASPVSGTGFFWGASDSQWTLTAYDASNAVIDTFNLPITHGSDAGDFVGFQGDPGIASVVLSGPSSDYVFIDNVEGVVSGSVPEPAVWAMMVLGLGLTGAALRLAQRRPSMLSA